MITYDLKELQKVRYLKTDPEVFFKPVWDLLGDKVWVAGGAVNRYLEGKPTNSADFDLFSNFDGPIYSKVLERVKLQGGDLSIESFLAWTFTTPSGVIQLIKRPYENLQSVLASFDFTARMVGTDGKVLVAHEDSLNDIQRKRIRHFPGDFSITTTSLFGLVKYGTRGYTIDHKESGKFMKAWGVPEQNRTQGYEGGRQ